MDQQLFSTVSRPAQVAAGLAVGVAGLFSLAIVVGAAVLALRPDADFTNSAIVGTLFLVLGLPSMLFSYRLLSGKARTTDGGLLNPTALRIAGAAFIIFPTLSLIQGSWHWVLGLFHFGACGACFILAKYRERLRFNPPSGTSSAP